MRRAASSTQRASRSESELSPGWPAADPDLPAPVDAAWIAEAFRPGRVLTYSRRDGWTDHGTWQAETS